MAEKIAAEMVAACVRLPASLAIAAPIRAARTRSFSILRESKQITSFA
jgi:hypothetical protein